MDYTETKKAFRQIEDWRKEIAEKEQRHINNITNKDILIYLARIEVKNLSLSDVSNSASWENLLNQTGGKRPKGVVKGYMRH